ncbi:hypothetical protein [Cribrihabitans pelagius]|uniref:hypothetical protein n=1 Tax=Cribrihabitans pelagius TaxID=1765746 RepID=UPI003B5B2B83
MIYPIVLASGSAGENATQADGLPAHFSAGPGLESRFQAVLRALSGTRCAAPLVITGTGCRLAATAQAAAVQGAASPGPGLLLEPGGSKPAAAAAVAALHFQHRPEALLLIVPASHHLADAVALDRLLLGALPDAAQGRIVALGAAPGSAALGFGLLDCRSPRPGRSPQPAVLLPAGCKLTEAGPGALHNTGVYLLRAGTLLAALKRCAPRILQAAKAALAGARGSRGAVQLDAAGWQRARSASFEEAVASRAGSLVALASGPAPDIYAQWEADRRAPSAKPSAALPGVSCDVIRMPLAAPGFPDAVASHPGAPAVPESAGDVPQAAGQWSGTGTLGGAGCPPSRSLVAGDGQGARLGSGLQTVPESPPSGAGAPERAVRVERLELQPGARLQLPPGAVPGHLAVLQGCALLCSRGRSRLLWEDQSAVVPAGGGLVIENPTRAPLHAVLVEACPRQLSAAKPLPAWPEESAAIVPLPSLASQPVPSRPRPC